jgi:CheY-like chemotaxis protein
MRRVLLVDDDRAIRELLTCALEYEGYSVTSFPDGSWVVASLDAAEEPCTVLMDLMMPRMDGWAVCRALAARPELLARHPVVLMSAGSPPESAIPREASAFIRKPFDLEVLYRLLASLSQSPMAATATAACPASAG